MWSHSNSSNFGNEQDSRIDMYMSLLNVNEKMKQNEEHMKLLKTEVGDRQGVFMHALMEACIPRLHTESVTLRSRCAKTGSNT